MGLVGVAVGIWLTCYFWYCALAYDAPLIYPDNYKALVRWPLFGLLSGVCIVGSVYVWRGRFLLGALLSIGSYFVARTVFYAIDNYW